MTESLVGLGDLRKNLGRYIRRVKTSETLVVTDRRRPVAILMPLPTLTSVVDRLVAEGRVWPAKGSLSDFPPPLKIDDPDISAKIRQALDETRADTI